MSNQELLKLSDLIENDACALINKMTDDIFKRRKDNINNFAWDELKQLKDYIILLSNMVKKQCSNAQHVDSKYNVISL